jgi:uncharacterized protein YdeI (YjbR/CyaY-like superfamily)
MSTPNPAVDELIDRVVRWRDETEQLRGILLACGLNEELKWRQPCYTFGGRNVAIIQGFKAHCSLMFFKGSLLDDDKGVLVSPGEHSQGQRRIQFTSVGQVEALEAVIRTYVERAVAIEKAGLRVDFHARYDLTLPAELSAKLEVDPVLAAAFEALTPGRRRGYVLHIAEAKRSKTRVARIERARDRILAGKGLNER